MAAAVRFTQALFNGLTNALLLGVAVTVTNMDNTAAVLYTDVTGNTALGSNVVNTSATDGTLTVFVNPAGSDSTSQYKFTPAGLSTQIYQVQPRDSAVAHLAGPETFTGLKTFPGLINSGMAGAAIQTRMVGGSSGAPTTGTWLTGDVVVDPAGTFWICTAGGSPGTWGGGGITDANAWHRSGTETGTGTKNMASVRFTGQPHFDITHPTYGADPTGAADSTAAINNALAAAVTAGGGIVWVPVGTYLINGTINGMLSTQAAPKFGISLRGASKFGSVLKKGSAAGNVIEVSGYHNEISNLTIDGNAKQAISGIIVRGYSANTTTYSSVRQLRLKDLYIKGCKEGVRFGHYSTLNGVTGDTGDADISDNYYESIWVDTCDYGWIEDGQNIILNHSDNVMFTAIANNHILCPRGGQPNFKGSYFGQSLSNVPKVDVGSSNGYFKDCRSECIAPNSPPFFQSGAGNGTSQVVMEGCVLTQPVGATNVDVRARGGSLTMIQCNVNGIVELTNTDYVGLGNDIEGGYSRLGAQTSRAELIFDKVFLAATPGPAQISGPVGRIRFGTAPTTFAYASTPQVIIGEGSDNVAGLVSATAPGLLYFLAGVAAAKANIYAANSGTNGGTVVIQTKKDGGALTNALTVGAAGGTGFWGAAAPAAQPAAPVTLADVIAVIRGCGLSA